MRRVHMILVLRERLANFACFGFEMFATSGRKHQVRVFMCVD